MTLINMAIEVLAAARAALRALEWIHSMSFDGARFVNTSLVSVTRRLLIQRSVIPDNHSLSSIRYKPIETMALQHRGSDKLRAAI
jgi:hypothetical protein